MRQWLRRMRVKVLWVSFAMKYGRKVLSLLREAYAEVEDLRYAIEDPIDEAVKYELPLISDRKRKELFNLMVDRVTSNPECSRQDKERFLYLLSDTGGGRGLADAIWRMENPGREPKSVEMRSMERVIDKDLNRPIHHKRFNSTVLGKRPH